MWQETTKQEFNIPTVEKVLEYLSEHKCRHGVHWNVPSCRPYERVWNTYRRNPKKAYAEFTSQEIRIALRLARHLD